MVDSDIMKPNLFATACLVGVFLGHAACGPGSDVSPQLTSTDGESDSSTASSVSTSTVDPGSTDATTATPNETGSSTESDTSSGETTSIPGDLVTDADGKPILDAVTVPAGLFWRGCSSTTPDGDDGGQSESS